VLADARQVEHEGLFEFEPHLFAHLLEDRVAWHVSGEPPRSSSQLADHETFMSCR
jgi:hypothetical protein